VNSVRWMVNLYALYLIDLFDISFSFLFTKLFSRDVDKVGSSFDEFGYSAYSQDLVPIPAVAGSGCKYKYQHEGLKLCFV
jgi:hypothetical protein